MKFSIIFSCAFLLTFLQIHAQDIDQKISGNFQNKPITQLFKEWETTYGLQFFYKKEWIEHATLTGQYQSTPLTDVLNDILGDNGLSYYLFNESQVVIIPSNQQMVTSNDDKNEDTQVIGNPINRGRFRKATIKGTIVDGVDGSPIIGAVILATDLKEGTVTNTTGSFSLTLPTGTHSLKCSFVGYEAEIRDVDLVNDGDIKFELYESSTSLNEIVVTEKRFDENVSSTQMSVTKLSSKALNTLPALMGETDVIKSMVLLPGVQTVSEASSGFNVRGGNVDQNLFLVDETPLFNTSHLFGFFTAIDPTAVEDVTLYKGAIPAQYGGRLASVMDISIKDGDKKQHSLKGGIGLINSKLSAEGPIVKDNLSYMVGGRATYSDWILKQIPDEELQNSQAGFYDINGKLSWRIADRVSLSVFGYNSNDVFSFGGEETFEYGNTLINANLKATLTDRLFLDINTYHSEYDFEVKEEAFPDDPNGSINNTGIELQGGKVDISYQLGGIHNLLVGGEVNKYTINPGTKVTSNPSSIIRPIDIDENHALESNIYLSDQIEFSPLFSITAGVRYSIFKTIGPGKGYVYANGQPTTTSSIVDTTSYNNGEEIASFGNIEPRFSSKYKLGPSSSVKFSYNRNYQYIQLISNTTSVAPTDVWQPAGEYIKPAWSDQTAIGYFRNFEDNMYETSAEVYYKWLYDLIEYRNGAEVFLNPAIETALLPAEGRAYGLELYAKKNSGRLTGWVSYTYSRTLRRTLSEYENLQLNNGDYFPAAFDKPHDLTTTLSFRFNKRWSISGNFTYSTGRPVTLPEVKYSSENNVQLVYFSDRNKYRIPDYHRLDLSLKFGGSIKKSNRWKSSWTLSVYNLYGRANPYSVYYASVEPSPANNYSQYSLNKLSIISRPIPTITYNFEFK